MKTVCIIQARMGSSRLPGKVLKPLLDKSALYWNVYRISKSRFIDEVVIATSTLDQDDAIIEECERYGWKHYRGSEQDLTDRYYQCAKEYQADYVVRITSDCPLVEPTVTDHVIATFHARYPQLDYVSNTVGKTYPVGIATEIFTFKALERVWHEDKNPDWREHATPYIYQNPDLFKLEIVKNPVDFSSYRITLDTQEDYELISAIYTHFGHGDFLWYEVIELLDSNPELRKLNEHVIQKQLRV
jgi:spore coat polysaccharide biosynthesis protein SpsF